MFFFFQSSCQVWFFFSCDHCEERAALRTVAHCKTAVTKKQWTHVDSADWVKAPNNCYDLRTLPVVRFLSAASLAPLLPLLLLSQFPHQYRFLLQFPWQISEPREREQIEKRGRRQSCEYTERRKWTVRGRRTQTGRRHRHRHRYTLKDWKKSINPSMTREILSECQTTKDKVL